MDGLDDVGPRFTVPIVRRGRVIVCKATFYDLGKLESPQALILFT
jgi:hypothetical protein